MELILGHVTPARQRSWGQISAIYSKDILLTNWLIQNKTNFHTLCNLHSIYRNEICGIKRTKNE